MTTPTLPPAVRSKLEDHAFSDLGREVGGVLVGTLEEKAEVTDCLPALQAVSGQTNVTFTHEDWDKILTTLEKDHPGRRIVGWYHTHPGFGLFLSEYDKFIQKNFFGDHRMLALVIDPLAGSMGWFAWNRSAIDLAHEEPTHTRPRASAGDEQPAAQRWSAALVAPIAAVLLLAASAGAYALGQQSSDSTAGNDAQTAAILRHKLEDARASARRAKGEEDQLRRRLNHRTATAAEQRGVASFKYRVRHGDTLWKIADFMYGDGGEYHVIQAVNPGLVPGEIPVGSVVKVPISAGKR